MSPTWALDQLRAAGDPERATTAAAYHKALRPYLGVPVPVITALAKTWREDLSPENRVALADGLWRSDIHEARVAAAKLLTQARIKDDDGVWALVHGWAADFDAWAIADHACDAINRRLIANPARLDDIAPWTRSENVWVRRAALVVTLPWTKQNHPTPEDLAIRDRVLSWAETMADDREWFIQKAIAWWLRDLSKHDAPRTRAWLDAHAHRLRAFARKEAALYL